MGRPRLKGSRLPDLSVVAEDPKTAWVPITVNNWYGGTERVVEIVSSSSHSALWYSTGLPVVPLRWVPIREIHWRTLHHDTVEDFHGPGVQHVRNQRLTLAALGLL